MLGINRNTMKTYNKMILLPSFEERFRYLKLSGQVGLETFGNRRYLNQILYSSDEWRRIRRQVIVRDNGCDLGCDDCQIFGKVFVHHINPITETDILENSRSVFDLDNLVCVSFKTHNAIHYRNEDILQRTPVIRKPNDTCPWR